MCQIHQHMRMVFQQFLFKNRLVRSPTHVHLVGVVAHKQPVGVQALHKQFEVHAISCGPEQNNVLNARHTFFSSSPEANDRVPCRIAPFHGDHPNLYTGVVRMLSNPCLRPCMYTGR